MPFDDAAAFVAAGSFRDPQGQVVEIGDRVFRALQTPLAAFPQTWSDSGPLAGLTAAGKVWPARPLDRDSAPAELLRCAPHAVGFLEHPRLSPITYPYEWPFELLKRAALLHLDVHRAVLEHGLTLSDGSAYNVQFVGTRPVFIDALAFEPYVESRAWAGYAQFCESFLNPLLLAADGSECTADIYRARLRGVSTTETARQLGGWRALRRGVFVHVMVNAMAERASARAAVSRAAGETAAPKKPASSRAGLELLLGSLRKAISRLELRPTPGWGQYEFDNSYGAEERRAKSEAVREFVARVKPRLLLDIGCNAGEYSEIALQAGAGMAIGLERDRSAVELAIRRGDAPGKSFLPLQVDIQTPTPDQGWDLAERRSLRHRLNADALLCLALVHHLALGEGVPLDRVIPGIVKYAPRGLIEFVPRDDPMSRQISGPEERLRHRYDLPAMLDALSRVAVIGQQTPLTASGRVLVEYRSLA